MNASSAWILDHTELTMTTECWLCSEAIDPGERTAKLAEQLPVHRRCLYTDANGTFGFERTLSDDSDAAPPSVAA